MSKYDFIRGTSHVIRSPDKSRSEGRMKIKFGVGFPEVINVGLGWRLVSNHEIYANIGLTGIPGSETIYIIGISSLEHRWLFGSQIVNGRRFFWTNGPLALVPSSGVVGWNSAVGIDFGKKSNHRSRIDIGVLSVFTSDGFFFPSLRFQKGIN